MVCVVGAPLPDSFIPRTTRNDPGVSCVGGHGCHPYKSPHEFFAFPSCWAMASMKVEASYLSQVHDCTTPGFVTSRRSCCFANSTRNPGNQTNPGAIAAIRFACV